MEKEFVQTNMDVLFALGPGRPASFHIQYDGTPESWANVLHRRRLYHARCQAADEAYAHQHPGLIFQRLCDRPEITALLEDVSPSQLTDE